MTSICRVRFRSPPLLAAARHSFPTRPSASRAVTSFTCYASPDPKIKSPRLSPKRRFAMKVMIIGGGKIGTYLADYLIKEGHEVRLIEQRAEELPRITRDVPREIVTIGNGTDPDVLEQAGIRSVNVVAAVTGTDETNLIVTSLARFQFMVPRTIARTNHPKNAW